MHSFYGLESLSITCQKHKCMIYLKNILYLKVFDDYLTVNYLSILYIRIGRTEHVKLYKIIFSDFWFVIYQNLGIFYEIRTLYIRNYISLIFLTFFPTIMKRKQPTINQIYKLFYRISSLVLTNYFKSSQYYEIINALQPQVNSQFNQVLFSFYFKPLCQKTHLILPKVFQAYKNKQNYKDVLICTTSEIAA